MSAVPVFSGSLSLVCGLCSCMCVREREGSIASASVRICSVVSYS